MAAEIKLNAKELKFVNEYLKGSSATQACIKAGYSEKGARVQGVRMLTRANIKDYISQHQAKQVEKSEVTLDRLRQECARIAMFDIRKLYRPDGSLIPIHELDDDTAAAISGVEVYEELYRGKIKGSTKKVKMWSKNQAIDSLGKMLGAFKADNEQANPTVIHTTSNLTPEEIKAYNKELEDEC